LSRVNVIVEGHSEEKFVNDFLREELAKDGVYLTARRIETSTSKRNVAGKTQIQRYRGGLLKYQHLQKDIQIWLKSDKSAFVTTWIDLYALPEDFPGIMDARQALNLEQKIALLHSAFEADIAVPHRFIPYVQSYEFEGLLFSNPQSLHAKLVSFGHVCNLIDLQIIRNAFESPEHINDSEVTAPSKRLLGLAPRYDKRLEGPTLLESVYSDAIQCCLNFSNWLARLRQTVS
jgi:hypothetical protein